MDKKIILYIAISLDGFIAKEDGNLDWLTKYNDSGEDYGFLELYDRIGTVLVGGTTYRQVEDPYKGKEAYVFTRKSSLCSDLLAPYVNKTYTTRKEPEQKADNIHFVSGDVKEVLNNLKLVDNKNIWLIGGAYLVDQFLSANLIDEYIITIIPTLLGSGIPLFQGGNPGSDLELLNVKSYDSGLVQLHYVKRA